MLYLPHIFACTLDTVQFATDCFLHHSSVINWIHPSHVLAAGLVLHSFSFMWTQMLEECSLGNHCCALATSHPINLATNFFKLVLSQSLGEQISQLLCCIHHLNFHFIIQITAKDIVIDHCQLLHKF